MQYIQSFNNHHSLCIIQTNHIHPALLSQYGLCCHLRFFQLLFLEWAHPRNFYKKQPLWLIKRYFGDKVSSFLPPSLSLSLSLHIITKRFFGDKVSSSAILLSSLKSSALWHGFHHYFEEFNILFLFFCCITGLYLCTFELAAFQPLLQTQTKLCCISFPKVNFLKYCLSSSNVYSLVLVCPFIEIIWPSWTSVGKPSYNSGPCQGTFNSSPV